MARITLWKRRSEITGEMRYYLNGLENSKEFEVIKYALEKDFGVSCDPSFDGIWFKRSRLRSSDDNFTLYWDEDLGNFLVSEEKTAAKEQRLETLATQLVSLLNDRQDIQHSS